MNSTERAQFVSALRASLLRSQSALIPAPPSSVLGRLDTVSQDGRLTSYSNAFQSGKTMTSTVDYNAGSGRVETLTLSTAEGSVSVTPGYSEAGVVNSVTYSINS